MTEIKTCKLPDCTYNIFEGSEWCILHCTKDHWSKEKKGKLEWDMDLVTQFWNSFKSHVSHSLKCTYMIFPSNMYEGKKSVFCNSIKNGLDFSSSTFLDTIPIKGIRLDNINFTNCKNLKLHISSCYLYNTSFYLLKSNTIFFEFCDILKCDFSDHSDSSLKFESCKKTENCKFNNSVFSYLAFGISKISNSVFYGTKVKKGCENTFRIIKRFHYSLSDNINADIFHARELREIMNKTFKEPINEMKCFSNNFMKINFFFKYLRRFFSALTKCVTEGFVYVLNFMISCFGQNWILPLFWFFLFSIYFYYIIDIDGSRSLDEFSMFVNPFLKNIDEKYKGFYTLWLVHKIISTIFIYHFIIAFKRKTKK